MAINYVKFSRRTPAQYAAAAHDSDTLYFVIEQDENTGLLYLGDKLIAGSAKESDAARIKLDDLTDVIINTAELKDKSILVYDKHTNNWINSELNGFIFRGATSLSSGGVGLVPAPLAGQENYYLKGDCTWGKIPDTVDSSNVIGLDKLLNEKANIDDV